MKKITNLTACRTPQTTHRILFTANHFPLAAFCFLLFCFLPSASFAQAAAPTNFTATPVGISLCCHLSWTNPATTVAGEPLTHITKIVLEREGDIIKEIANPAVGAAMNFTDNNIPATGSYHYVLYAITNEGKGLETELNTGIGDGCYFRFVMENQAGSWQGWKGSYINIAVNGVDYCTVTLQNTYFLEKIIFISSGTLTFTWVSVGPSDPACAFDIYNPLDELIFSIEEVYDIGMFLEYENQCNDDNNECDPATNLVISTNNGTVELTWEGIANSYSIMKNGTIIEEVTETYYLDEDIENGFYSYCIFANYNDSCLSSPICDDIMVNVGVEEHKNYILIYPNPANDVVNITGADIANVKICNNMGQLILIQYNTNVINISKLPNGIYVLSIETSTKTIIQKKIIIKK
jgi:hypothetical protein